MSQAKEEGRGGASQTDAGRRVLCVRLPLQEVNLLLPHACVAEIVNLSLRGQDGPYLGELDWRGVRIPVVSLERACGQPADIPKGRSRLAVLYGLRNKEALPYYALLLHGVPHSESVAAEGLEEGEASECELLGMGVRMQGQALFIPDLEAIEARLEEWRGRGL